MAAVVGNIRGTVSDVEIGPVQAHELDEAVGVLARGMRDSPAHLAVYGADPERRRERIDFLFSRAAHVLHWEEHMVVARNADGVIVGACGMQPPGMCQPAGGERLRLMLTMLRLGPGVFVRSGRWMGAWSKHDPATPHWHIGPLAVDASLQGQGIGSALMRVLCARMDAAGADAYLETDKAINVRFYEKFGFTLVAEQEVLGIPNWFMLRRANGRPA